MMRTAWQRLTPIALAALSAVAASVVVPPPARAAEYRLNTQAEYDVRPDAGRVDVRVTAAMTNTTPDPDGQFSVFSEVKFAIHDLAADVVASDADGALDVTVAKEGGVNVATVALREDLRFEQTADLTLGYRLVDSETAQQRIRPSVVAFAAWGFGTASNVTVRIPAGYEVSIDGDALTASVGGDGTVLRSGHVSAPAGWLALVTATAPATYTTLTASVPLEGGTADLHVRAFADDEAWGERTLDLLERALPIMESRLGIPYPHVGPLLVTEAVSGGTGDFGEEASDGEILVAYDQPPFTALHQVAHVWLSDSMVADRWIREGIASQLAATAGAALDVAPPYDPAAQLAAREAGALPLATWAEAAPGPQESYGFAASWALADEIVAAAGWESVAAALQRTAAGIGPYDPSNADVAPVEVPLVPLDSRGFLDQLESIAGVDLATRFAELVLSPEDVQLLPDRAEARAALADLTAAAGDWGVPQPILTAMRSWSFGDVGPSLDAARDWIEQRDRLVAEMEAVGLAAPSRLREAYRTHGGREEAVAELEREQVVVAAYGAALDGVNAPRSLLERLGLLGGESPDASLRLANTLFADGDLSGAAAAIRDADALAANAEMSGGLRIASAVAAVLLAVALIVILLRRRSVPAS
jgi:hypothetical protein